ncbi:hypothetical protein HK103_006180 [Boothiomyces macroporosus]|uniref:Uncharacterized protein n=1 Tax=Boothiomyces macroporosus TaxID=261099 RepID=A0AAD5UI56_9FUNG|nr:hypothetical protein HK103_006180 [Boothiomyces macroporosus]
MKNRGNVGIPVNHAKKHAAVVKKKKAPKELYIVDKEIEQLAKIGVGKVVEKYGLVFPTRSTKYVPKTSSAQSTKDMDEGAIKLMKYFFKNTGRYENLLMLMDEPPLNPPSMCDSDLALILKFKDETNKGKVLKDFYGEIVVDVGNRPVICQGGWKAQTNVKRFNSVITKIHQQFDEDGRYTRECEECFKVVNEKGGMSCNAHVGDPRPRRKGNPSLGRFWKDDKHHLLKVQSVNPVNGAIPLTPMYVLRIRERLLFDNLPGLQFYVLMILSIKLFLRSEEAIRSDKDNTQGLTIDSIDLEGSIFQDGVLEGLLVKVKGKTDTTPVHLLLWADNDNTLLCPIRHLLVYVYYLQIKDGPLFPDISEIENPPPDGVFSTSLTYDKFNNKIDSLCKKVVHTKIKESRIKKKWGTHCLRKTGYLFAIWGSKDNSNAAYSRIMQSARHSDTNSAVKYELDARTQFAMANYSTTKPQTLVGEWKPCFVSNQSNFNYVEHSNPTELYTVICS